MQPSLRLMHSIGGLVVKLAVAIGRSRSSLKTPIDSASPGFDSRPMQGTLARAFSFVFAQHFDPGALVEC